MVLIEKYKTASKYFWVVMDLMCQNVTSTSLSIVKCMEKYGNKFVIGFFKMMPP